MSWKPKVGERYWEVVVFLGFMSISKTVNKGTMIDDGYIDMGNCYRTRREAEVVAKRVRAVIRKGGGK